MKFYFPYIILFIFIISNKLFLFNEEFLILICFIAFCFTIYNKLSLLVQSQFDNKINSDKSLIIKSLFKIENNLNNKHLLNNKINKLKNLFILLKKYYKNLTSKFLLNFLSYTDNLEKTNIINKLFILKLIEIEYSKFIFFLIKKKINSLSKIYIFLNNRLFIKKFKVIDKINKLILLKKI
uniref:ATP synthase F1 subunit 4 n=1 Tax=Palisada intermedia TaxID=397057 RepID=UPI00286D2B02|nr:ATP synthase F1 subunit 4 [Palisada intermedia]WMC20773.1 ATP synthase F1 subunit 4 [Palisada intermedia]